MATGPAVAQRDGMNTALSTCKGTTGSFRCAGCGTARPYLIELLAAGRTGCGRTRLLGSIGTRSAMAGCIGSVVAPICAAGRVRRVRRASHKPGAAVPGGSPANSDHGPQSQSLVWPCEGRVGTANLPSEGMPLAGALHRRESRTCPSANRLWPQGGRVASRSANQDLGCR